jgi:hypothetical protein
MEKRRNYHELWNLLRPKMAMEDSPQGVRAGRGKAKTPRGRRIHQPFDICYFGPKIVIKNVIFLRGKCK